MLRVLMKRIINSCFVITVILLLCAVSCDDNLVSLDDYFKKINTLTLDKEFMLTSILDFDYYNDSTYVLTDFFAKRIFSFNTNTSMLTEVGRNGTGPGEYTNPETMYVKDRLLCFSDLQTGVIKTITLQGEYAAKDVNIGRNNGRYCFDSSGNIYALMKDPHSGYVKKKYIITGNERLSYPIPIESGGKNVMGIHGGGICCDYEDNIFFCNPLKYEIIKLDSSLKKLDSFRAGNVKHFIETPNWNKKIFDRQERIDNSDNGSTISKLAYIKNDAQGFILVFIVTNRKGERLLYLDIWKTNGVFAASIDLHDEWFVGVSNNTLFTLVTSDTESHRAVNMYRLIQ